MDIKILTLLISLFSLVFTTYNLKIIEFKKKEFLKNLLIIYLTVGIVSVKFEMFAIPLFLIVMMILLFWENKKVIVNFVSIILSIIIMIMSDTIQGYIFIEILNENVKERIHECILNAHKKYSAKATELQKNFTIKAEDKIINIEYNKILFFETSNIIHKVVLHAVDRQIEFYAKMKDVEVKLDERFYRCHRSFLVNKDNIKEIDKNNRVAYMINGQECLVATRLLKGLIK